MNCVWPITCPTPYGHAGMYPCKNNKKYPDKNFVNNFFLLSGIKKKGKKKKADRIYVTIVTLQQQT